jgi:hypothetical protein
MQMGNFWKKLISRPLKTLYTYDNQHVVNNSAY